MKGKNNPELCPNCKTGYDSYLLDNRSPFGPYLRYHDGTECTMFVAMKVSDYDIEIDREESENEK